MATSPDEWPLIWDHAPCDSEARSMWRRRVPKGFLTKPVVEVPPTGSGELTLDLLLAAGKARIYPPPLVVSPEDYERLRRTPPVAEGGEWARVTLSGR